MIFLRTITIYFIVFFCISNINAQTKKSKHKIMVMARPQKQSILLRWAVTTPLAWQQSNQYGFVVERYTITRDKKILSDPDKKLLSLSPIKPASLEAWENIVQKNNYAAVIAQAIYGDDFELSGGDDKGIAKIVNKSNELEQRFAMSLYAADNNFEAAKLAGWGIEDIDVKPNEKYLYRIISAVPGNKLQIDSASVFVGIADYTPLPAPAEISGTFNNKNVMLSWDCKMLRSYYNSYFIEKSADAGKTFTPLSDIPVTNLNEKDGKSSAMMYYVDSLQDNTLTYQYRIKGITPFGEIGPPSTVVSGNGKETLAFIPNIRSSTINDKGILELQWELDEKGKDNVQSFTLNQSPTENGIYKPAVKNIAAQQRSISFNKLYPANYFTITAIAKNGEKQTSFPVLVQQIDSFPPAIPVGLEAKIDSNGIVKLKWKQNTEKDLLGYKVFRANNPDEEMAVLTDSFINRNGFKDTVSIRTLNNKLYYAVAALDKRYNQSVTSAIIELKKPDVIPPSSPIFTNYKLEDGKVNLTWVASSDEDVATHLLYRKEEKGNWKLVQQFKDAVQQYTDKEVQAGSDYLYKIISKDFSGLESPPAEILQISIPGDLSNTNIKSIDAYIDRNKRYIEISWKDNLKEVEEYQLYKAVKGQPVTLWQIVKPQDGKGFIDQSITINTEYEYGIKAVLKNGALGKYKSVTVKY